MVSRWLKGSVQPSAHNLSRLSALIATQVEGFRTLDWDRDTESLAAMFGADPGAIASIRGPRATGALPLPVWDQMLAGAASRGPAYEGFFRSTRPHPMAHGRHVHEWGMIRRDDIGLLRLSMGNADTVVDGWMMPMNNNLLFSIAADVISGTLMFGIFNGVGASRVDVFDGLVLIPAGDMGRAPMATAMLSERLGELSGDREADDRHFAELVAQNPLAPEGSIPEPIQKHLARDIGPAEFARGGDWLLSMTLGRTMSRGRDWEPRPSPDSPTPPARTPSAGD